MVNCVIYRFLKNGLNKCKMILFSTQNKYSYYKMLQEEGYLIV